MICVPADPDDECELPEGEAGIVWDAICFTVLLAQRRVFLSYYFLYVVSDLKSSKILASRSVLQQKRPISAHERTACQLSSRLDLL